MNEPVVYPATAAPTSCGCARPDAISPSHRRYHRRGPRFIEALLRKRRRQKVFVSPVLPQGGGPCESGPDPPFTYFDFTSIFHSNVRGFITNSPKLEAQLYLMDKRPSIICLTETWLNNSVGAPILHGYAVVCRRDRDDGRIGGGVIIFALTSLVDALTTIFIH